MMKILVLFTCFNRKQKTEECIRTLSRNRSCLLEYIIVDDNSSDGTEEMLKKYKGLTVIKGTGNSFYSGGMRIAIDKAKSIDLQQYEYVMFINDDVQFFDGAIDKLVDYAVDKGVVVAGATCNSEGNFSYGGARRISRFKPQYHRVRIDETDLTCDTTCANCVLIPRKIFEELPNIDCVYRHAMGDLDYFFEATNNGCQIISSDFYVGICNDNPVHGGWRDTSLPRMERVKLKESIKGLPQKEWFHYLKKNHGVISAGYYSFTPYIRILLKR